MSATQANTVRLIFPHQLFEQHFDAPLETCMVLVEHDLFFRQYAFHKQKLLLHRASMRSFADALRTKGYHVEYIETAVTDSSEMLDTLLRDIGAKTVSYYDVIDDWLQQAIDTLTTTIHVKVERMSSPGFLTSTGLIEDYFDHNPNRMNRFYEWQRKRLNILMDGNKPAGGKWSYDVANRKKLPKTIRLPDAYPTYITKHVDAARAWVRAAFANNPGSIDTFAYATTHEQAREVLQQFIRTRLVTFGPYEDAIAKHESQLFHSALSPLINIGLLTPDYVVSEVLKYAQSNDVPIESLEGFIRQIIGWREYMRATYIRFGRKMRTQNFLNFDRTLAKGWWNGSVGIEPIDTTICRVLETGYAHHIERLMILGNSMVLLRIDPDAVYEWFMSMFIDAYDWVMVPNVYAMSQFAAGELITTKPYISGSNYILKMSDYTKGEWSDVWDALYWQFVGDYREVIEKNYRSRMVVTLYDRFDEAKKASIQDVTRRWLA